jgi:hypothetical protein
MTTAPYSDLVTKQERLAGDELLAFIRGNESMTKKQQCNGAGYIKTLNDGSIGCNYTEFYMALLEAKGMDLSASATEDKEYDDWHKSLTDQDKDLIDEIQEKCGDLNNYTPEECREFMDMLSDLGITTKSQFEAALRYQTSSHNAGAEFAEYEAEGYGCTTFIDMPWVVIDWEASWERNLSHDYSTLEFKGVTYFFSNYF